MKTDKKEFAFRIVSYALMSYGVLSLIISRVTEEPMSRLDMIISIVTVFAGFTINGVIRYSKTIDKKD